MANYSSKLLEPTVGYASFLSPSGGTKRNQLWAPTMKSIVLWNFDLL